MIIGTGIDIVEIKRVEQAFKKMGWTFAHQVLGKREIDVFAELVNEDTLFNKPSSNYLARRFAAKEAFIKAADDTSIDMRDIQVLNTESGKPYFSLSGKVSDVFNRGNWVVHLSISDSNENVVASVILENGR